MDQLSILAIAAGGVFIGLFFFRLLGLFLSEARGFTGFVSKHVIYPYVLKRRRMIGPWTWGGVGLFIIYVAVNVFSTLFKLPSIAEAGRRTGTLAVINMAFLIHVPYLDIQADLLATQLRTCHRTHWAIGWMVGLLTAVHIALCLAQRPNLTLADKGDLFPFIVCSSPSISEAFTDDLRLLFLCSSFCFSLFLCFVDFHMIYFYPLTGPLP